MLAVALLPLAGAGVLARRALTTQFAADDVRRREAAGTRVTRVLDDHAAAQRRALARFCTHDYLVDRTLLQLASRQFDAAAQSELGAVLPEVRDAMGLDTLSLVRGDGIVLASAHYPGTAGSLDAHAFAVAGRAGEGPRVRSVRVREAGGPRDRLVLESACVRRRGGVAVAVLGGVALEGRLREALSRDDAVRVSIAVPPVAEGGDALRRVIALRGDGGRALASVVVETDDGRLSALLGSLDALLALAAGVAVLVTAAVAAALAAALARPIVRVADAADRIAAGDRSVQLTDAAGAEVGRLVGAFNQMSASLAAAEKRSRRAERLAAWRDIARQMAHEIKNPLTPIRMGIERLQRARSRGVEDFDARFVEETAVVLEEVERLRRLVEDFSGFARMPRPKLGAVSVAEWVGHVTELHGHGATRVTVVVVGGGTLAAMPTLRADRDQLTQVLVNLVANGCWAAETRAAEGGGAAPAVAITVARVEAAAGVGERVRVTVADNGPGIDAEVMARLFEPYVTRRPGGTGLGLAIAYRIVTDHGGSLAAQSTGDGARFVVELPVAGPGAVGGETLGETGAEG